MNTITGIYDEITLSKIRNSADKIMLESTSKLKPTGSAIDTMITTAKYLKDERDFVIFEEHKKSDN